MMNWANEKRWYPHTFCLIPTSSLGGHKVKTPTHYTWWEEKFLLFPSLNKSSWSNLLPFCFIPGAPLPPHQRLPKADKFPIHIALHLAIFTDSLLAVSALSQDSLSCLLYLFKPCPSKEPLSVLVQTSTLPLTFPNLTRYTQKRWELMPHNMS